MIVHPRSFCAAATLSITRWKHSTSSNKSVFVWSCHYQISTYRICVSLPHEQQLLIIIYYYAIGRIKNCTSGTATLAAFTAIGVVVVIHVAGWADLNTLASRPIVHYLPVACLTCTCTLTLLDGCTLVQRQTPSTQVLQWQHTLFLSANTPHCTIK